MLRLLNLMTTAMVLLGMMTMPIVAEAQQRSGGGGGAIEGGLRGALIGGLIGAVVGGIAYAMKKQKK